MIIDFEKVQELSRSPSSVFKKWESSLNKSEDFWMQENPVIIFQWGEHLGHRQVVGW